MRRAVRTSMLSIVLALAGCPDDPQTFDNTPDIGPICDKGFVFRLGQCRCVDDTACPDPEKLYCDAISGFCLPRKPQPEPDAGLVSCAEGALRCSVSDGRAIERCKSGGWTVDQQCSEGVCLPSATGYYCTVCQPGVTRCKSATEQETCSDNGDRWIAEACPAIAGGATCSPDACHVCVPGEKRCSADLSSLETCEAGGLSWSFKYCDFTGDCNPTAKACVPPACIPGTRQCKDSTTIQDCKLDASGWTDTDCRTIDANATPNAKCISNACSDPCAEAARTFSYQGCDYWAAVLQNPVSSDFKGGATDGQQPSKTSEYALVIANPWPIAVNGQVTRMVNGVETPSPYKIVSSGNGSWTIAANGLATLRLPWQSVARTGQNPYAYHLTSDLPVSVYQFNPVTSSISAGDSYTNDASLLLPTHILSKRYVVVGQETVTAKDPGGSISPYAGLMAIVGTEDGTQVTVKFAADTEATYGTSSAVQVAARKLGDVQTYTLNRFDVLQILSSWDPATLELECTKTPMYLNSNLLHQIDEFCRHKSDTTGSIVTSDKPVAVFGGASCTLKPYNRLACDHVEEQMPPFETWGKTYVGVRSHVYKDTWNDDVDHPSPDYWRVVAACGKADCPAGTKVKIDPAPKKVLQAQFCPAGGGDCVLPPVDAASGQATAPVLEFEHDGDFVVTADQPVMLAQYLTSEDANKDPKFDPTDDPPASGDADEGDPSLILTAPVEQWRRSYHVLNSPTMNHNYLNLAVKSAAPNITIDGKALSKFTTQKNTVPGGYTVYRVSVGTGQHTISSPDPIGVTVYGYDRYVSYGYTGGLDLTRITTIVPGG